LQRENVKKKEKIRSVSR